MLCAQLLQHVGVRRIAALSFLDRRQSEAVKKDLTQHFGGIDVEFLARVVVDRRLRLLDPLGKHLPEGQQRKLIGLHALVLYPRQYRAQWQLHVREERIQPHAAQLFLHRLDKRGDGRRAAEQCAEARRSLPCLL